MKDYNEKEKVLIKDKVCLTVKEAAAYSNIGEHKLRELLHKPFCPFVLYSGRNVLIKRAEFEKYLITHTEI